VPDHRSVVRIVGQPWPHSGMAILTGGFVKVLIVYYSTYGNVYRMAPHYRNSESTRIAMTIL